MRNRPSPAAEPEQLIALLRPSVKRLALPALSLLALSGLTPWLAGLWRGGAGPWLVLAGAIVLLVLSVLWPWANWRSTRYSVTSKRIIREHGLFTKERGELLHARGYQVTVRRSLGQRLFRAGTLRLSGPAETTLELADVPAPLLLQSVLHDLVHESGGPTGLIAAHGANTTDATKRFDPTAFDDTSEL